MASSTSPRCPLLRFSCTIAALSTRPCPSSTLALSDWLPNFRQARSRLKPSTIS